MIAVEDLAGEAEIVVILAHRVPRQLGDGLEIAGDDGVLGARGRDEFETLQLAVGLLFDALGQSHGLKSRAQIIDLLLGAVALSEFALDRADLLAQVGASLGVGEFVLDIGTQLLLELGDVELTVQGRLHFLGALLHIDFLEKPLFLDEVEAEIRREEVGEDRR